MDPMPVLDKCQFKRRSSWGLKIFVKLLFRVFLSSELYIERYPSTNLARSLRNFCQESNCRNNVQLKSILILILTNIHRWEDSSEGNCVITSQFNWIDEVNLFRIIRILRKYFWSSWLKSIFVIVHLNNVELTNFSKRSSERCTHNHIENQS